jgi:hypothetical protein
MKHGHGSTNDSPQEKQRRREQPASDEAKAEENRQRSLGGGKPNELGVTQGQNGEQGNTVDPDKAAESGKIRH